MGNFILFVLGVFVICSVLYGIAAGVATIARGISSLLGKNKNHDSSEGEGDSHVTESSPTACSRRISDLQALFGLYLKGALTQDEFLTLKQSLLGNGYHSQSIDHGA